MSVDRLPDSTLALTTELRDLALGLEPRRAHLLPGTPVVKTLQGTRYWYLQSRGGGLEVQRSLGPESPELLDRLASERALREELEPEIGELQRLNEMAIAGGAFRESAAATRVLELLAAPGLFRAGAVLVGTRAFGAYGSFVGFRPSAATRTQDFDVAVGPAMALALPRTRSGDVPELLSATAPPFLAVPGLDPREPSTSFKLRGRELRVDFVTPMRGRERELPVDLPGLGLAAWPLRLLDYLMADPVWAVVTGTRPVLVRVPQPARFALHKLWLARSRPAAEIARAAKDRAQAATLLEILLEDRPHDLENAASALGTNTRAAASIRAESARLPSSLRDPLLQILAR